MKDFKVALGSWARAFLVAALSLAAAGITDPKALLSAGLASCLPPIIRYLNPNDSGLGIKI